MDDAFFQAIVHDTVRSLPEKFRDAIRDVVIVIEDLPPAENGVVDGDLLGLYEGVPITEWERDFSGKLPDTITLFRENILAFAESDEEVPHVIRETLLHEIAHHFGFEHDKIDGMEERWKKNRKSR